MTATQTAFSVAGIVASAMAAQSAQRVEAEIHILETHTKLLQEVNPHNDPMSNLLIEGCLVDYASVEENL